jgi:hypothetical protein
MRKRLTVNGVTNFPNGAQLLVVANDRRPNFVVAAAMLGLSPLVALNPLFWRLGT